MKSFALLFLLILLSPAAARALNPAERRMAQTVEREAERTVQLLERTVNQNMRHLEPRGGVARSAR